VAKAAAHGWERFALAQQSAGHRMAGAVRVHVRDLSALQKPLLELLLRIGMPSILPSVF
jgi:hypothetical protein